MLRSLHFTPGEVVSNLMRVPDGAGEPVQFGHRERAAGAANGQSFTQPRAVLVSTGETVIDIDPFGLNAQS